MGKTHLATVVDQAMSQLAVSDPLAAMPSPTPQVNFINGDRLFQEVGFAASGNPLVVAPSVSLEVRNDRGRTRWDLGGKGVGIGLLQSLAVVRLDSILVQFALTDARYEQLPNAVCIVPAHLVLSLVPSVEVPHDADRGRIRCPDTEVDSRDVVDRPDVGTQPVVDSVVSPFADQIQIELGQK